MKRYFFLLLLATTLSGQTMRDFNISDSWYRRFTCEPTFKTVCDSVWFYNTSANKPVLYVYNDNDGNTGAELRFVKDSDTPADLDNLGHFTWYGKNSSGIKTLFSDFDCRSADISAGTEASWLRTYFTINGSSVPYLSANGYLGNVIGKGEIVINDGSSNADFRVESDGEDSLLVASGSGSKISTRADSLYSQVEEVYWYSSTSLAPVLNMKNTNGDAYSAIIDFIKDSNTPADDDLLGRFDFYGNDSGVSTTIFSNIYVRSADVTNTNESGSIDFSMLVNGSKSSMLFFDGYLGTVGKGEIVVNDSSRNIDFRIENDVNDSALVVSGAGSKITANVDTLDFNGKTFTNTLNVNTFDVTVEAASILNQDLTSDANVNFGSMTAGTLKYKGVQTATYDAGALDMWVSLAGDGTDTLWISIDGTNAVSFVGAARQAKH